MVSITGQEWVFPRCSEDDIEALQETVASSPLLARILAARGYSAQDLEAFLSPTLRRLMPDPSSLLGMDVAVNRVVQALVRGERVALFGDYDVDGATSLALLVRYFRCLGVDVALCPPLSAANKVLKNLPKTSSHASAEIYVPDRLTEGYGVNIPALEYLIQRGAQLFFLVDCGTTSVREISWAVEQSVDTIVLDHHIAGSTLPPALTVINPHQPAQPEIPWVEDLCSAGLVFLFLVALQRELRRQNLFDGRLPDLMTFCDLVALGTVCDVMPLRGLNRAFVRRGLELWASGASQEFSPGLQALCNVSHTDSALTAHHLGFALGPRINAGGRIGSSTLGVELLTTTEVPKARALAQTLDGLNKERRKLESITLEEACSFLSEQGRTQDACLLVGSDRWHPGVVGIVASRLKEKYHRPSFVASFQEGVAKGSARSVDGLDIGEVIHKAHQEGIIEKGGGHAQAGGFTVSLDRWDHFRAFLLDTTQPFMKSFCPRLRVDAVLALAEATLGTLDSLENLEPLGTGNPAPRLAVFNVRPQDVRFVGQGHAQCRLVDAQGCSVRAVAFRSQGTPLAEALLSGKRLHVIGALTRNLWKERPTVQFVLEDAALVDERDNKISSGPF